MAEIKSTLELAMERTKKMTISEKEKEEIKWKEVEQKANSLSSRYIEGHLLFNEILREMERMNEKTEARVKEMLLSQWIDSLSLSAEAERLFKGIQSLKGRSTDALKLKHHQLTSQYEAEKDQVKEKIKIQLGEALRKEGIYGSAVTPNIEASPPWKKEAKNLDQRYGEKLEKIKEELRNL